MYQNQMWGNGMGWGNPYQNQMMMQKQMMQMGLIAPPTNFPSVVDRLKNKAPYQLNAPSMAQLFPSMQNPNFSFQNSMPTPDNSSGAGRFVGLLGGK
jgi:hypothetical protein